MFEVDLRLCCDWLCQVGVCVCFAVFVDDSYLKLMLGCVVGGCVKFVSVFCFVVVVDDRRLNVVLGYVVLG